MTVLYLFETMFFPIRPLLDLLCPPHCAVCGEPLEDGAVPVCESCANRLATPDGQYCSRCFGRRFALLEDVFGCPRCMTTSFRFRRVIALGEYEGGLRETILRAKTDKTGILATALATLLVEKRRRLLEEMPIDLIVPVPMHATRLRKRGTNNPDFLAEEIARRLRRPCGRHLLRRIRRTELQYRLAVESRRENVEGAFALVDPKRKKRVVGKHVLLVDDILTTAATCNEIAALLYRTGSASVTVCVLGRAEGGMDHAEIAQNTFF